MESNFIIDRLNRYSKPDLIEIILKPVNRTYFASYTRSILNNLSKQKLINLILSEPECNIDNNFTTDRIHVTHKKAFDDRLDLLRQNPVYDPDRWTPRPHQVPHIQNLVRGLTYPGNNGRSVWDGSETGLGKTPSAVLTAIALGVRYVLVICPDPVVAKWHYALNGNEPQYRLDENGNSVFIGNSKPMGLFDYRVATYSSITGTSRTARSQLGKHKPNPSDPKQLEDLEWIRITVNPKGKGRTKYNYDWSLLPGSDDDMGTGGCFVIWDESHKTKGTTSQVGYCFEQFNNYMHSTNGKYIRSAMLTATVLEKTGSKDLGYLMHAFGFIKKPTTSSLKIWIYDDLRINFKRYMGEDWTPELEKDISGDIKLRFFIRIYLKRIGMFSQIIRPSKGSLDSDSQFTNEIRFEGLKIRAEDITEFKKANREIEEMLNELAYGDANYGGGILGQIQRTLSQMEVFKLTPVTEMAKQILSLKYNNGAKNSLVIAMTRTKSVRHFAWRFEAILEIEEFMKTIPTQEQIIKMSNPEKVQIIKDYIYKIYNEYSRFKQLVSELKMKIDVDDPIFRQYEPKELYNMSLIKPQLNKLFLHYIQRIKIIKVLEILIEYESHDADQKIRVANGQSLQIKSLFNKYPARVLFNLSLEDVMFEHNKWIKYINYKNFRHVCIYVSNFGMIKNSEHYDPDAELPEHRVGEGKNIPAKQRLKIHSLFQNNRRRIFLTNIQIANAGIDLHDTSVGGMRPRVGIISPGIIARELKQMFGRFVRDGQTSDSLRLAVFVDDVEGEKSWEATFMAKLAAKLKNIELMHDGKVSLDILKNIEESDGGLIKSVVEDMKTGSLDRSSPINDLGNNPLLSNSTGRTSNPLGVIDTTDLTPSQQNNTLLQQFLRDALGNSPASSSIEEVEEPVIVPESKTPMIKTVTISTLRIWVNSDLIYVDTTNNANPGSIENITLEIINENKLDPTYFTSSNTENHRGIIISRKGLLVSGIPQNKFVKDISTRNSIGLDIKSVGSRELDYLNFNPPLIISELKLSIESPVSMLVTPRYPLQGLFPEQLLENSLNIEHVDGVNGKLLRFQANTTAKLILAIYACRAVINFESPGIFKGIKIMDKKNIAKSFDPKLLPKIIFQDGIYKIVGHVSVVDNLKYVLSGVTSFALDLLNDKVFGNRIQQKGGLVIMDLKGDFGKVFEIILNTTSIIRGRSKLKPAVPLDSIPNINSTVVSNFNSVEKDSIQPNLNVVVLPTEKQIKSIRLTITNFDFSYSPAGKIMPDMVIKTYGSRYSNMLVHSFNGDMVKFTSNNSLDGRLEKDILLEFVGLACVVQYLADINNLKRDLIPSVEIIGDNSEELMTYIPRLKLNSEYGLWIAPVEIKELVEDLLKGTLNSEFKMRKNGYVIDSQSTFKLLTPFFFVEELTARFIITGVGTAEIIGYNGTLPVEESLGIKISKRNQKVADVMATKSIIDKESGGTMKSPNYVGLIRYYVRLRLVHNIDIIFEEEYEHSSSIRLVRDNLWASRDIIVELRHNNYMVKSDFLSAKSMGNSGIYVFKIRESGLDKINKIFGNGISSTQFIVRMHNMAEIVTSNIEAMKIAKNWINVNSNKIEVTENTRMSLSFKSTSSESNYFDIMRLYFKIKILKGATLVSQLDSQNELEGKDALNSIMENTSFGNLYTLTTSDDSIFLVAKDDRAATALLEDIPNIVASQIQLQEIVGGVLGRKLTKNAIFHISYALDNID